MEKGRLPEAEVAAARLWGAAWRFELYGSTAGAAPGASGSSGMRAAATASGGKNSAVDVEATDNAAAGLEPMGAGPAVW